MALHSYYQEIGVVLQICVVLPVLVQVLHAQGGHALDVLHGDGSCRGGATTNRLSSLKRSYSVGDCSVSPLLTFPTLFLSGRRPPASSSSSHQSEELRL